MLKTALVVTITSLIIGLLYLAAIGVNVASADTMPPAEQQIVTLENPDNLDPTIKGTSVVARNGHYDVAYDGNTCFQWITDWMPVVVENPSIITYTTPVDDFDLIYIIACEE